MDCSQLVKIVLEPEEWLIFASYLENIKLLKTSFNSSEIINIPRAYNSMADSLATQENNRRLTFIWMRSYQFGLWSLYESVYVGDKKKLNLVLLGDEFYQFLLIRLNFQNIICIHMIFKIHVIKN